MEKHDIEAALCQLRNKSTWDMDAAQKEVLARVEEALRAYHGESESEPKPKIEAGATVRHNGPADGCVLACHGSRAWVRWPCGTITTLPVRELIVIIPATVEVGDTVDVRKCRMVYRGIVTTLHGDRKFFVTVPYEQRISAWFTRDHITIIHKRDD